MSKCAAFKVPVAARSVSVCLALLLQAFDRDLRRKLFDLFSLWCEEGQPGGEGARTYHSYQQNICRKNLARYAKWELPPPPTPSRCPRTVLSISCGCPNEPSVPPSFAFIFYQSHVAWCTPSRHSPLGQQSLNWQLPAMRPFPVPTPHRAQTMYTATALP